MPRAGVGVALDEEQAALGAVGEALAHVPAHPLAAGVAGLQHLDVAAQGALAHPVLRAAEDAHAHALDREGGQAAARGRAVGEGQVDHRVVGQLPHRPGRAVAGAVGAGPAAGRGPSRCRRASPLTPVTERASSPARSVPRLRSAAVVSSSSTASATPAASRSAATSGARWGGGGLKGRKKRGPAAGAVMSWSRVGRQEPAQVEALVVGHLHQAVGLPDQVLHPLAPISPARARRASPISTK